MHSTGSETVTGGSVLATRSADWHSRNCPPSLSSSASPQRQNLTGPLFGVSKTFPMGNRKTLTRPQNPRRQDQVEQQKSRRPGLGG